MKQLLKTRRNLRIGRKGKSKRYSTNRKEVPRGKVKNSIIITYSKRNWMYLLHNGLISKNEWQVKKSKDEMRESH